MTAPTELLEPSFLDLVAAIEQATELSDEHRRHWVCSVRQIAKWLDRPITLVPARWDSRYGFPSAICTTPASASGQKPWRTTRPT